MSFKTNEAVRILNAVNKKQKQKVTNKLCIF